MRTCGTCISKSAIQLLTFNPFIKSRFLHEISTYLIKIGKKNMETIIKIHHFIHLIEYLHMI